ncbi:MAG: SUMF1/EgtB/PvdO family nonheme iron enzyme [Candidatus Poribacteria bacterium]|nr:SUMF1/EgtB/PvdO family nonheme iron enzyme [Candidatus Poribacteria bacterium]
MSCYPICFAWHRVEHVGIKDTAYDKWAGNAWEWCQDWGSSEQISRVLRAGFWFTSTNSLRVAYRSSNSPKSRNYYVGFRCVSGSN